jgi:peptidoglycan/LPS O-acetylase OafA/YrhL
MAAPPSASAPDTANAFDALRCLLAVAVVYSHSFFLGGYPPEHFLAWTKGQAIAGELAVLGFFGLSGYLVTASYIRSHGFFDYLTKRVRRIVPGFWGCILVTACVIAPAIFYLRHGTVSGFPWINGESSALRYVVANLAITIGQWSIAGVMDGAIYGGSLNGSLWSLWPETVCYVIVALLGSAGLLTRHRPLLLLGVAALFILHAAHVLLPTLAFPVLPTWLVLVDRGRYVLSYLVGAALWLWRNRLVPDRPSLLLLLLVLAALARFGGLQLLAPLFIPLALVYLGQCFALRLKHDVSYGLYIYGFPVQQLLAATALPRAHWSLFFAASLAITLVFAFLSWRFVENPFLRRRAPAAA